MAFVSKTNGVDDMVMLSDLSEGGINANLRKRFDKSQIYTYVGPVLVSVNPFRNIPDLYSERLLKDVSRQKSVLVVLTLSSSIGASTCTSCRRTCTR
jgi:myosin heavy subunit